MALVCSCERGPGVSGSKAVQVLAQVTQRPHILLWQLLCLLFAAGGHQQPLPTRIFLVAAPGRSSLLGSQRQRQRPHVLLWQLLCLRRFAGASQLRLCLTAALCGSSLSLQMAANGSIEPWF